LPTKLHFGGFAAKSRKRSPARQQHLANCRDI